MSDSNARLTELVARYGEVVGARIWLQEQRERVRNELRARVADSASLDESGRRRLADDIALHKLNEEKWALVDAQEQSTTGFARLAAKMPWAHRIALTEKAPRPLIWKADIQRWRRKQSDYDRDLAAIRDAGLKAAASRSKGDPLEGTLTGVWTQLLRLGRYTAGMINATYKALKKESGWSVDTLFECVTYFDRAGVLEVVNTRERGKDSNGKPGVFNGANVYVLQVPPEAPAVTPEAPHSVLAALSATVKTVAAWFGLEVRSSGYLNTTPMAARDLRAAEHPEPA